MRNRPQWFLILAGFLLLFAVPAEACIWYTHTITDEMQTNGEAYHFLVGAIPQHSEAYWEDLIAKSRQVLASDPKNFQARLDETAALLKLNRLAEAGVLLQALDRDHPDNYEVLSNIAILHKRAKRFDQAIEYTTRALTIKPEGHMGLGDLDLKMLRWQEELARTGKAPEKPFYLMEGMPATAEAPQDPAEGPSFGGSELPTPQLFLLAIEHDRTFPDTYANWRGDSGWGFTNLDLRGLLRAKRLGHPDQAGLERRISEMFDYWRESMENSSTSNWVEDQRTAERTTEAEFRAAEEWVQQFQAVEAELIGHGQTVDFETVEAELTKRGIARPQPREAGIRSTPRALAGSPKDEFPSPGKLAPTGGWIRWSPFIVLFGVLGILYWIGKRNHQRKTRGWLALMLLLTTLWSVAAEACLWHAYTIQDEMQTGGKAYDFLVGAIPQHSDAFWEQMIAQSRATLASDPSNFQARLDETAALVKLNRLEEALPLLVELDKDHPNNYEVLSNFAILHKRAKRFDQAIEYTTRALAIKPEGHMGLGDLDLKMLRWQEEVARTGMKPAQPYYRMEGMPPALTIGSSVVALPRGTPEPDHGWGQHPPSEDLVLLAIEHDRQFPDTYYQWTKPYSRTRAPSTLQLRALVRARRLGHPDADGLEDRIANLFASWDRAIDHTPADYWIESPRSAIATVERELDAGEAWVRQFQAVETDLLATGKLPEFDEVERVMIRRGFPRPEPRRAGVHELTWSAVLLHPIAVARGMSSGLQLGASLIAFVGLYSWWRIRSDRRKRAKTKPVKAKPAVS